jgi:2-polyprenyl-6-methoxyphenol hydroxylase-like FAD-dependent oxidoreductase
MTSSPVDHNLEWDVIVVGGGMSGSMAAVAAARNGARTLLIERDACLGGTMTNGMVGPMMTFHSANEQVVVGLAQEVVERLQAMQASPGHIFDTSGYVPTITPYDHEAMKLVLQRMLLESGASVLFHSLVEDVVMQGTSLRGVVVRNKGGLETLSARQVVDASGDGDVAVLAGAPFQQGRASDGLVQPVSLMFKMTGVDLEMLKDYLIEHPEVARLSPRGAKPYASEPLVAVCAFDRVLQESIAAGDLPLQREHVLFFSTNHPSDVIVNMSRVQHVNPVDAWELTRAELESREQIFALTHFLQQHIPGFAHARVTTSGSRIGIRESRRIMGEYVLTAEDVLAGRRFEDGIARSAYPIDIHAPDAAEAHQDVFVPDGQDYEIPYRCLVPQNVDNLLVAGRCISTTHEAHASTRVSPNCMAFGQAAGTAAAICARQGVTPRQLDVQFLRHTLIEQRANLRREPRKPGRLGEQSEL